MTQYLVHKAVEFASVTARAKKAIGLTCIEDLDTRYDAQLKYDGCNAIVIVTPNGALDRMLSRTGEYVKSCNHIIKRVRAVLSEPLSRGESFAVLGEVWQAGTAQAVISGNFRRHEQVPSLQFIAFDMLTEAEFSQGRSEWPFKVRYGALWTYFRGQHPTDTARLCETYHRGTYGSAQEMCNQYVAKGGFDGLILRDPDGLWTAGSGTTGEIIKLKNVVTYDLRVVGVEEGKGKYKGTLGSLICKGPKGNVSVSGMTDAERDLWWRTRDMTPVTDSIIGCIVEVHALGFTEAGSLREPRFKGIRYDKECADFE